MSDENGNGAGEVLTAAQVMAKGRKLLQLPSGGNVLVGSIEVHELTELINGLPDVSALAAAAEDNAPAAARRPETKAILARMATVIRKGTIDPELFEKRKDGPTPLDFPIEDRALMFKTILELTKYSKAAGAEVLPLSETVA